MLRLQDVFQKHSILKRDRVEEDPGGSVENCTREDMRKSREKGTEGSRLKNKGWEREQEGQCQGRGAGKMLEV